jgi:hypothetical protein
MAEPLKIEVQSVTDEIAENISKVSEAVQALNNSKLKQETAVLLIQGATKLPKGTIKDVLFAVANLKHWYLK